MLTISLMTGLLFIQFTVDEGDFKTALSKKMEIYKTSYPMEGIYIHTDRDVYSPGDQLSFRAFIRDLYSLKPSRESDILNLALMNYQGEIILNSEFGISEGQVAGQLLFADDISEGKYFLVGYTRLVRDRKPEYVFIKELFLSTISFPETIIHLSVHDTLYDPGNEAEIHVTLLSREGRTIRNSFEYEIRENGASFLSGEGKTDRDGKSVIHVKLPEFQDMALITLDLTVKRARTSTTTSIVIPTTGLPCSVDFFPEGGKLIDGVESKVAFIAEDYFGNPAEIEGQLLDPDNKVLTCFKSQSNGLGYFTCVPDRNRPNKVIITKPRGHDKPIDLPEVSPRGAAIMLAGTSKDELSFDIVNTLEDKNGPFHVIAEQNGTINWYRSIPVNKTSKLTLPVSSLPGGVIHVTLFNSRGDALSHRAVFFSKSNSRIQIKTDQNEYIPEEEVKLNLQMQNMEGALTGADLSVSVTDVNLNPDWNQDPDILTYFLLGPGIGNYPFPPGHLNYNAGEIEEGIEIMMLTIRDEKFNWKELMNEEGVTGRKTDQDLLNIIKNSYRSNHLGMLHAQIENSQFFNRYILKYNLVFPEYYLVNRRYFSKIEEEKSRHFNDNWIQDELASGTPVLDVIRRIKNFQLMDNKIVFYGPNSLLYQDGALIVFNGLKMGTDARILGTFNPHDIANIRVITNPTDVLMYTGLNSVGIIEITTKGGGDTTEGAAEETKEYSPVLFWNPFVYTLEERETSLSFESSFLKSSYTIEVQGFDEHGNPVYATKEISVY